MPKVKRDIDIERLLVWAYQTQRVDVVRKGRVGPVGNVDSCARLERMMAGGAGGGVADCHPDADMVHDHVLRLGQPASGLVIEHAKAATRPDACVGVVIGERGAIDAKGRAVMVRDRHRNPIRPKMVRVAVHPCGRIEYGPVDEIISFRREVYRIWHSALLTLCASLDGLIDDWSPKPPAAKPEPWSEMAVDKTQKT